MVAIQEAAVTIDDIGWKAHRDYAEREALRPVSVTPVDQLVEAFDTGIQPGEPIRPYIELLFKTYLKETYAHFPKLPAECAAGSIPSLGILAEWKTELETTTGKAQQAIEVMVNHIREELAGNAKRIGFGAP